MRSLSMISLQVGVGEIDSFLSGYELIHHRVTQGIREFNQFEIKRIELRDTLCYSVVKTHYGTVLP